MDRFFSFLSRDKSVFSLKNRSRTGKTDDFSSPASELFKLHIDYSLYFISHAFDTLRGKPVQVTSQNLNVEFCLRVSLKFKTRIFGVLKLTLSLLEFLVKTDVILTIPMVECTFPFVATLIL